MKETPQQYTQRILGYVDGKQPLEVQATTAEKLEHLVKDVPTTKLRERPAGDKWSVSEIVAHLGDAEIVRSEEHTSELQSRLHLVCRLLLEKKKNNGTYVMLPNYVTCLSWLGYSHP